MFRAKKSMLVNAPVDKVFNYLASVSRHGEWGGGDWQHLKAASSGPTGVGSTYKSQTTREVDVYDIGGGGGRVDWSHKARVTTVKTIRVREFVPNERLVFERRKKGENVFHVEHDLLTFELEPTDEGTRIKVQGDEILQWWVLAILLPVSPLVWPIAKLYGPLVLSRYLRRIRSRLDLRLVQERQEKIHEGRWKHRDQEVGRNVILIPNRVLKEPGISHTKLLEKIVGERRFKEMAIRQLLDEAKLRCEQDGRGRRYFAQQ